MFRGRKGRKQAAHSADPFSDTRWQKAESIEEGLQRQSSVDIGVPVHFENATTGIDEEPTSSQNQAGPSTLVDQTKSELRHPRVMDLRSRQERTSDTVSHKKPATIDDFDDPIVVTDTDDEPNGLRPMTPSHATRDGAESTKSTNRGIGQGKRQEQSKFNGAGMAAASGRGRTQAGGSSSFNGKQSSAGEWTQTDICESLTGRIASEQRAPASYASSGVLRLPSQRDRSGGGPPFDSRKPLGHGSSGFLGQNAALMMIKRQDKAISNSKRPKQDLEAQALERGRLEKSNASQVANVMPTYYDPRHAPQSSSQAQKMSPPYDPGSSRRHSSASNREPTSSSPYLPGRDSMNKRKTSIHLSSPIPVSSSQSNGHSSLTRYQNGTSSAPPKSSTARIRIQTNGEHKQQKQRSEHAGLFAPDFVGPSDEAFRRLQAVINVDEDDSAPPYQPKASASTSERVDRRFLGESSNGTRSEAAKKVRRHQVTLSSDKPPDPKQSQLDFGLHSVRDRQHVDTDAGSDVQYVEKSTKSIEESTKSIEKPTRSSPDPLLLGDGDRIGASEKPSGDETPEEEEDVRLMPGPSPTAKANKARTRTSLNGNGVERTNGPAGLDRRTHASQAGLCDDPIEAFNDDARPKQSTSTSREQTAVNTTRPPRRKMQGKDGPPTGAVRKAPVPMTQDDVARIPIPVLEIFLDGENLDRGDVELILDMKRKEILLNRRSKPARIDLSVDTFFAASFRNEDKTGGLCLLPRNKIAKEVLGLLGAGELWEKATKQPIVITLRFECRKSYLSVIQQALEKFGRQPSGALSTIITVYRQKASQGYDFLEQERRQRGVDDNARDDEDVPSYDIHDLDPRKPATKSSKKRAAPDPPETRSKKRTLLGPFPEDDDYEPERGARTSAGPARDRPRRDGTTYENGEAFIREPSPANRDEVLFPWPLTGRSELTITAGDNSRLREGDFLNDTLIEFGLKHIVAERKATTAELPSVHVFNSYFFHKLSAKDKKRDSSGVSKLKGNPQEQQDQGMSWPAYDSVRKWTSSVDVFSKDFIIVPINEHYHWYLAVIVNAGRVLETGSDIEEVSDSLKRGERRDTRDAVDGGKLAAQTSGINSQESRKSDDTPRAIRPTKLDSSFAPYDPGARRTSARAAGQAPEVAIDITISPRRNGTITKPRDVGPKRPLIMILDSLGDSHKAVVNHLNRWLAFEAWDKKQIDISYGLNEPSFGCSIDVPKQNNLFDCGIYVLHFVRVLLDNPTKIMQRIYNQLLQQKPKDGREETELLWQQADVCGARQQWRKIIEDHKNRWLQLVVASAPEANVDPETCSQSSSKSDLELVQAANELVEALKEADGNVPPRDPTEKPNAIEEDVEMHDPAPAHEELYEPGDATNTKRDERAEPTASARAQVDSVPGLVMGQVSALDRSTQPKPVEESGRPTTVDTAPRRPAALDQAPSPGDPTHVKPDEEPERPATEDAAPTPRVATDTEPAVEPASSPSGSGISEPDESPSAQERMDVDEKNPQAAADGQIEMSDVEMDEPQAGRDAPVDIVSMRIPVLSAAVPGELPANGISHTASNPTAEPSERFTGDPPKTPAASPPLPEKPRSTPVDPPQTKPPSSSSGTQRDSKRSSKRTNPKVPEGVVIHSVSDEDE